MTRTRPALPPPTGPAGPEGFRSGADRARDGRIAVGVSGAGSNLRALAGAAARRELGGSVVLVFADRPCPALDWAIEAGLETAMLPGLGSADPVEKADADESLAATLRAVGTDVVVLAGYMRIVGPATLGAFPGRILNTHPALLPAFPGAHAVRDALAAGVLVTGATVHVVTDVLDGGPIVGQEAVDVLPGDDEAALHERIRAVEHRLLPRVVALALAGALDVVPGRRVTIDAAAADRAVPMPRRALLSVSDKTGLAEFAAGLVREGFELVSTGGTAKALRDAGLPVTDVAAVTAAPEMLDGRVKTLHPRIHGGILADRRRADHRETLIRAGIAPFEVVAVNLYPFAKAAERPGIALDELIEEIDIGGPALVRAAAKNHASVAVVTSPARYAEVLAAISEVSVPAPRAVPAALRASLAVDAFRHTAAYDSRIAAELPGRMAAEGLAASPVEANDPFPQTLPIVLEKVETLRYGENPHQPAARYLRVDRRAGAGDGPFATDAPPLQGKSLSYNNVLDASAAAAIGRALRPPACVIVKHTNPSGAAERASLLEAWRDALAGDPVSAFGGVVAVTGTVDGELARALTELFLEVVIAPGYDMEARRLLAAKPNLRLIVDETLGKTGGDPAPGAPDPLGALRSAGGAVLVTAPDTLADDPGAWRTATRREPTDRERTDLDLAWRLVRGVTSNAIVLVRDGMLIGLGSGQTSRVDAARQAVEKARAFQPDRLAGAACASDAFYPFPDAVEVCLAAGVTAFAQPGGSVRDAAVVESADAADAAMVMTGVRHFRH